MRGRLHGRRSSARSGLRSSSTTSPKARAASPSSSAPAPGISPRTLSERLRVLEQDGLIEKHAAARRAEYELTEKGNALLPIIEEMRRFGHCWLVTDDSTRTSMARRRASPRPPSGGLSAVRGSGARRQVRRPLGQAAGEEGKPLGPERGRHQHLVAAARRGRAEAADARRTASAARSGLGRPLALREASACSIMRSSWVAIAV